MDQILETGKGQAFSAVMLIETFIATLLVIGLLIGSQSLTADIVRRQTLQVEVNRIENAAVALTSVPEGYIEVPMEGGYMFKYDSGSDKIFLKYQGKTRSTVLDIPGDYAVSSENAGSFTKVEGAMCIRTRQPIGQTLGTITFQTGECQ